MSQLAPEPQGPRFSWLPQMGTWKFHLLLGLIAIFILGPLGGVTATYMNFSIGFFVGGQVLAGILGSAVTYGYGAEGKHGANYMQTLAASVASMSGMAVLIQAMHWLGFSIDNVWTLIFYFLCIGMFGVGVGMLYTPILVDKMQLTYPSGFAVANILRALTDKALLKVSIGKLALGTSLGLASGGLGHFVPDLGALHISGATFGAGMVVGVRIALPAIFIGLLGDYVFLPMMQDAGWLGPNDAFRKLGFVVALGAILGAAIVDISLVLKDFVGQMKASKTKGADQEDWKKVKVGRLILWILCWGAGVFYVATQELGQEPAYVLIAMALVFVFMIVNGISLGISDSNPISSAFVLTVLMLASLGLGVAIGGLVCAAILLISVSIGGDMQQDRSTGWRLGSNRTTQFRYQVVGVATGALLTVGMAGFFINNNQVLLVDQTDAVEIQNWKQERALEVIAAKDKAEATRLEQAIAAKTLTEQDQAILKESMSAAEADIGRWQSAMTYKLVGAIDVFIGRPIETGSEGVLTEGEAKAIEDAKADPSKAFVQAPADLSTVASQKAWAAQLIEAKRAKDKDIQITLLCIGVAFGFTVELIRKFLRKNAAWQRFKTGSKAGATTEFILDVTILASPYASSFGAFVGFATSAWFSAGGVFSTLTDKLRARKQKTLAATDIPEDMSTNSLVGGGLIAGESLFYLGLGIVSMILAFAG